MITQEANPFVRKLPGHQKSRQTCHRICSRFSRQSQLRPRCYGMAETGCYTHISTDTQYKPRKIDCCFANRPYNATWMRKYLALQHMLLATPVGDPPPHQYGRLASGCVMVINPLLYWRSPAQPPTPICHTTGIEDELAMACSACPGSSESRHRAGPGCFAYPVCVGSVTPPPRRPRARRCASAPWHPRTHRPRYCRSPRSTPRSAPHRNRHRRRRRPQNRGGHTPPL